MNGNLIDTNVVIKLLNGNKEVVKIFDSLENIVISVITVGKLFYGAHKSSRKKENIKLFSDFFSEYPIFDINENVSHLYGELKGNLVKKGINIPENDIWISSIAIENNLVLYTYDRHFSNISNLKLLVH